MPPSHKLNRPALTLLSLTLLLAACANGSLPSSTPPVAQRQILPLPPSARQPTTPPECLPTCSAGASREFDSWLTSPTSAAAPGQPASAPTTR